MWGGLGLVLFFLLLKKYSVHVPDCISPPGLKSYLIETKGSLSFQVSDFTWKIFFFCDVNNSPLDSDVFHAERDNTCIWTWQIGCIYIRAHTHTRIYIEREGYLMVFFLNPPSDDRPTGLLSNVTANSKWTNVVCIHLAVYFIQEHRTINNKRIYNRLLLTFSILHSGVMKRMSFLSYDPWLWQ